MNQNLVDLIKTIENFTLDILLPKKCLQCQEEGSFLCKKCLASIEIKSWQVCPVCEKSLTEYGEVCRYCKQTSPPLDSLTTAANFSNKTVSRAVHSLKYKFVEELSLPLSKILIKAFEKNKLPIPDIIIPIPLHPIRLRWRGFNQAELLAQKISKNLLPDFPIEIDNKTLSRIKFTPPQVKLKKSEERQKNLRDAFKVDLEKIKSIKNKKILLIDDVSTTGSTLFEAASELRKLKPQSIHALVIARQEQ